jgi:c(7)-type cytochrome triheme protein
MTRGRRLAVLALVGLLPAIALVDSPSAQQPPKPARARAGGAVRFSHEVHAGRGVAIDGCASCHVLAADGRAAPPTSKNPHQPCATSGCHEDQFFSRQPIICAVCHDGVDPSSKQLARFAPRRDSEFGGEISHVSHARPRPGTPENGVCQSCHGDPYSGTKPPVGHAVCGACHGLGAGPQSEPRMAACGGCHRRGAGKGSATRPRSPWSVADAFDHKDHRVDPRTPGAAPRCLECHATIARAAKPEQIAAPMMKTCDGCHDGRRAFKTTGFGCAKCHAQTR